MIHAYDNSGQTFAASHTLNQIMHPFGQKIRLYN